MDPTHKDDCVATVLFLPINVNPVVFNLPTLAIFSAGLGKPILLKISGQDLFIYVLLICV